MVGRTSDPALVIRASVVPLWHPIGPDVGIVPVVVGLRNLSRFLEDSPPLVYINPLAATYGLHIIAPYSDIRIAWP
jgi:hypothetical protein